MNGRGKACQEHDRQGHALPAQLSQQVNSRRLRQTPIEDDDVGLNGTIERIEKRDGIGKAMDDKAVFRQVSAQGLAVVRVVFDKQNANAAPLLT